MKSKVTFDEVVTHIDWELAGETAKQLDWFWSDYRGGHQPDRIGTKIITNEVFSWSNCIAMEDEKLAIAHKVGANLEDDKAICSFCGMVGSMSGRKKVDNSG